LRFGGRIYRGIFSLKLGLHKVVYITYVLALLDFPANLRYVPIKAILQNHKLLFEQLGVSPEHSRISFYMLRLVIDYGIEFTTPAPELVVNMDLDRRITDIEGDRARAIPFVHENIEIDDRAAKMVFHYGGIGHNNRGLVCDKPELDGLALEGLRSERE